MSDTAQGPLIYRQSAWTRITHWIWAVCLFFLMLTGLQIFNAHPSLYIGQESGFDYDNAILEIGAQQDGQAVSGYTLLFGHQYDTTGYLGVSGRDQDIRAFPAVLTIPSYQSLATGRVIHFYFAWLLVGTWVIWTMASIWNGHARTLIPSVADLRALPGDVLAHARLRFHRGRDYNILQKLAYGSVMFLALPLMILTGLSMSPAINAFAPWLLDLFGGRQTARTLHFLTMIGLIGFFVVHIVMVLAAGPFNELRSIITGWYRIDQDNGGKDA